MDELARLLATVAGAPPLATFLLVFARVAPAVALAPVFGAERAPATLKGAAAFLFSCATAPAVASKFPDAPSGLALTEAAALEALTGALVGLAVRFAFEAAAVAGELIDFSRGATFFNLIDPMTSTQKSPLGPFFMQLQLAAFAAAGGVGAVVAGFARSYDSIPPYGIARPVVLGGAVETLLETGAGVLGLGFRLAAPAVATLFVLDVAVALWSRVAPVAQNGPFSAGATLKPILAVYVLFLTLGVFVDVAAEGVGNALGAFFGG
jgi:flagellar biosynthetic protein FliR